MIIAVDYDGTIEIKKGVYNNNLILWLKNQQRNGSALILNTCRHGDRLAEAVSNCSALGLRFNAINDNIPATLKRFGHNPRKIYADIYIDDKAVSPFK